jgi:dTDP-4-dehydrorhamnose reductase
MGGRGTMITTRILGSSGMLGSMIAKTFELPYTTISREALEAENPKYDWYKEGDWVINCIGKIKPYCDDVSAAIKVNALFPHTLPSKTIQIATDCVYSGKRGNYAETDEHDATDVYGKTKSLGEAPHIYNLRCSIIGPEEKNHTSLLDWCLSQNEVNGFTNHKWNGITTYHFSKIVQGVIREGIELPTIQHIVPADVVTKAELLRIIAKAYGKKIKVTDVEAPEAIDRTLSTSNEGLNRRLWKAAGYPKPPTVKEMVEELSKLSR